MKELDFVPNWISGEEVVAHDGQTFDKYNPHTEELAVKAVASSQVEVERAVSSAERAFDSWTSMPPPARGEILYAWVERLRQHRQELAEIVAWETGKPPGDAEAEVAGALAQGEFFSGEGMRLYGRSLTSGMPEKYSHTVRQAIGIAGLIVPANTPIANIAWKVFPALICGNTVVLKASEHSPLIALRLAQIAKEAGVPAGVLNIVQGKGDPAGKALVEDSRVGVISFTGSTSVGRWIAETAGRRLARVSLELGGKNPFVVCDDADIDHAVEWASRSAFSNAGQRCASGSRIIVFESIRDEFVEKLVKKANSLKLGIAKDCDIGPVISQKQQEIIFDAIDKAQKSGGEILCGGAGMPESRKSGWYVKPTLISELPTDSDLFDCEIFGPVATVQGVKDLQEALSLANRSRYGLTAAIHTRSIDRAVWFSQKVKAGMVNVNIGTYGSEPHMPFGGFGDSGNGTREPGVEALDVYSELKNISFLAREQAI
ncbi:MAG TPA: aldehyde dehydrogenase [Gammaproteobacteria bacterium]|nr:aldehyde dehydrogenase [Gammaproteobacteria bacterium]